MSKLIVVESPTKAKTISKFVGNEFSLWSSYGHVRDLPKNEMGIDIEHDFKPKYIIPPKIKKRINELKKLVNKSESVYFATDEDREGEAIAWHISQIIKDQKIKEIKRITFHEITEEAIKEALMNPREIDIKLVNSQQARRILDRLVGYELSPFLWRKIIRGLSAGRVQSVALRLVVEREREIQNFKPQEYWSIEAEFKKLDLENSKFIAKLYKIDHKILDKLAIKSEEQAQEILNGLKKANYIINKIQKKEIKKTPNPPFITSTLQQEANRHLGFSAKRTMFIAQQLYEGIDLDELGTQGLITYMRTDSFNLAEKFLEGVQKFIKDNYGADYFLDNPRRFKTKSRLAQEAHEAIRPTDIKKTPESIEKFLNRDQFKLYNLIWRRAVASQMKEAVFDSTSVDIETIKKQMEKSYIFRATGSIIKFDGYLKVYPEKQKEAFLPPLKTKELLELINLAKNQHFTQPPSRYSEAGLIKALEQNGIGRPSTYAPIINTIQERGYVKLENRRLKPEEIGFLVNDLLVKHFPEIVDLKFTAQMEDKLDKIAQGKSKWIPVIKNFYKPFKENLLQKEKEISKKELTEEPTKEICEKCNKPMIIKMGRYGKFFACSNFPKCRNTKPLPKTPESSNLDKAESLSENLQPEDFNSFSKETCDKCGAVLILKESRYGKFLACSAYPKCKNIKPIIKTLGIKCPECEKGEIIEKKTRRGKTFYSCNRYPDCKFASWQKLVPQKCPNCEKLMIMSKDGTIRCNNKNCEKK